MNIMALAFIHNLIPALLEGLAVAVVAFMIPAKALSLMEVVSIALTAASTMIVLDRFAPSVGRYVRHGAGFGIGTNLVTV